MHLILQKIEFGREYSRNDLEELLEELIAKKIILEEDITLYAQWEKNGFQEMLANLWQGILGN